MRKPTLYRRGWRWIATDSTGATNLFTHKPRVLRLGIWSLIHLTDGEVADVCLYRKGSGPARNWKASLRKVTK